MEKGIVMKIEKASVVSDPAAAPENFEVLFTPTMGI